MRNLNEIFNLQLDMLKPREPICVLSADGENFTFNFPAGDLSAEVHERATTEMIMLIEDMFIASGEAPPEDFLSQNRTKFLDEVQAIFDMQRQPRPE